LVRTIHANLMLAARAGYAGYHDVANSNVASMLGERLFHPYAYPEDAGLSFERPARLPETLKAGRDAIAPAIPLFLDELCERILALEPRILGISSVFQQTLAASAVALRIKAKRPGIRIVLGGANASSPMGDALAEIFPWIDHFFSGEADIAFPDFCASLLEEGAPAAPRLIHCLPLTDMRRSPMPDFGDYFADLDELRAGGRLPAELPTALPVETSRGCWWGVKNHCTFCGLNGETMAFREKPAAAALAEFDALARWGVGRFALADNIMPLRYLGDLLPALAEREAPPDIFYEVKANLTAAQLGLMQRAGITAIQPGIESLATPVLKLMHKGVSAHQNLMLLRNCRSLGMRVIWNYLYGFPGAQVEDYAALLPLIPAIEHLEPPQGMGALIVDRFSPYFNTPGAYGIGAIKPIGAYRGLYPRGARLADIAYHFQGDYTTDLLDDVGTRRAVARAIGEWRLQWIAGPVPELRLDRDAGKPFLIDTRRIARAQRVALSEEGEALLQSLERPRVREWIDGADVELLNDFVAGDYVVEHEGKLLSVVTAEVDPARTVSTKTDIVAEPA